MIDHVHLILLWVFIAILILMILTMLCFRKVILEACGQCCYRNKSKVTPNVDADMALFMKRLSLTPSYQKTGAKRRQPSDQSQPEAEAGIKEVNGVLQQFWPQNPLMYKMNVWRYSPVVKAIAVNEKEELDYELWKRKRVRVKVRTKVKVKKKPWRPFPFLFSPFSPNKGKSMPSEAVNHEQDNQPIKVMTGSQNPINQTIIERVPSQGSIIPPIKRKTSSRGSICPPIKEKTASQGSISQPIKEKTSSQGSISQPIREETARQGIINKPIMEETGGLEFGKLSPIMTEMKVVKVRLKVKKPRPASDYQQIGMNEDSQGSIYQSLKEKTVSKGSISQPIRDQTGSQGSTSQPIREQTGSHASIRQPIREQTGSQGSIRQPIRDKKGSQGSITQPITNDILVKDDVLAPASSHQFSGHRRCSASQTGK